MCQFAVWRLMFLFQHVKHNINRQMDRQRETTLSRWGERGKRHRKGRQWQTSTAPYSLFWSRMPNLVHSSKDFILGRGGESYMPASPMCLFKKLHGNWKRLPPAHSTLPPTYNLFISQHKHVASPAAFKSMMLILLSAHLWKTNSPLEEVSILTIDGQSAMETDRQNIFEAFKLVWRKFHLSQHIL